MLNPTATAASNKTTRAPVSFRRASDRKRRMTRHGRGQFADESRHSSVFGPSDSF